ncbi:N-6 DNA methylase [Streptacidiphilus sp. P02-A3a]|uniref:N-6 DNA methylase n=1 Tax=Streptacidiphilus sp. P02-A3a TaxID=2704468 RepID=UPI0015FA65DD|nr:N-6 DNA methylase [Streptacidiphilus sp. P02-A3a]QMU72543.1 N-6 DNA methylase [Streptacidiphilus sp. P02-A3a]
MDGEEVRNLLSRTEIADLAGVKRPAVTNWERRYPDYPPPVRRGDMELFPLEQLLTWLGKRTVPANAREPHENPGTTYADRVRAALGAGGRTVREDPQGAAVISHRHRSTDLNRLTRQLTQLGDQYRGRFTTDAYTELLLTTIYAGGLGKDVRPTLMDVLGPGAGIPDSRMLLEMLRIALPADADAGTRQHQAADLFQLLVQESNRSADRGEFYTPPSIAQLMADMLVPDHGTFTLLDPFCRAGDILTAVPQATSADGAHPHALMRSIAAMNLELHGINGTIVNGVFAPTAGSLRADHAKVDLVLSNPPFATRYQGDPNEGGQEGSWPFGSPPSSSADFGWLQYALARLKPGGRAGVIMPYGAGFRGGRERSIRAGMVEAGVVECIVALPSQLFVQTGIPVTLWVMRATAERLAQEILFIDASERGEQRTAVQRQLRPEDIDAIVHPYKHWRGLPSVRGIDATPDGPAARAASTDEIRANDYDLTPARYLVRTELAATAEATAREVKELLARLVRLNDRQQEIDARVSQLLEGLQP